MEYIKYAGERILEGDPPGSEKPRVRALPPRERPQGCSAPARPPGTIFSYMLPFDLEKYRRKGFEMKHYRLEAESSRSTYALRRSDSALKTSLREGKIEAMVITNNPLIVRGPIFINIFKCTISSQTLVHLLYSIFVSKL